MIINLNASFAWMATVASATAKRVYSSEWI